MKIVINKEAALRRTKAIVAEIKKDAVEAAAEGKVTFIVHLESGVLNGVDINELSRMVQVEYEGTIQFSKKLNAGDSYMLLEIVDPWQEPES
jgi:hypothetical protein